jgi:hypothetical protein
MDILFVDSASLDAQIAATPDGGVANVEYSQDDVVKAIAAVKK